MRAVIKAWYITVTKPNLTSGCWSPNTPLWFDPTLPEFQSMPDPCLWATRGIKYLADVSDGSAGLTGLKANSNYPTVEDQELDSEDWEDMWEYPFQELIATRDKLIQFKILHIIYFTPQQLHRTYTDSYLCSLLEIP